MKDTVITAKRKKQELIVFIICFIVANLLNLYAIITKDNSSFSELFTSLGYVFVASVVLYIVVAILRLIFFWLKSLFTKKGNK